MSSWANASRLNKKPFSLYSSDKVKGGCKSCWAAILIGFVLVIGIVIVCLMGTKEAAKKGYCPLFNIVLDICFQISVAIKTIEIIKITKESFLVFLFLANIKQSTQKSNEIIKHII